MLSAVHMRRCFMPAVVFLRRCFVLSVILLRRSFMLAVILLRRSFVLSVINFTGPCVSVNFNKLLQRFRTLLFILHALRL